MTRSLSARLTVSLLTVLGLSVLAMGVAIDLTVSALLMRELDATLLDDANALAGMVEPKPNDAWEFDEGDNPRLRGGLVAYEVRLDDGRALGRSVLEQPLQAPTRSVTIEHTPRGDEEVSAEEVSNRKVIVRVERSTHEVDALLARLRLIIALSGLAVIALASVGAVITVRRSLSPLDTLIARLHTIDAGRLDVRLETEQLPLELTPLVARLNDLLQRLEQSFLRERRVSGDLSHELRTPLAGLRALLEVGLATPREAAAYQETLRDCLAVVVQTTHIVERMLELVHVEAMAPLVAWQPFELRPLVEVSWAALSDAASKRGLRFENRVPEKAAIEADQALVMLILSNLLSNAVTYTEPNGLIAVESSPENGLLFSVIDSGPRIPAEAVPRLFERLFRGDPARTSSAHLGLGLAIVEAAVERIGATVTVEQNDMVRFEVTRKP